MTDFGLLDVAARGMAAQRAQLDRDARSVAAAQAGFGDSLGALIATLNAQRAYEADASLFDIGKRLAERTLDIER